MSGDLHGLQIGDPKETMVLCPWNNTEYLNVAAYLEAFLGFYLASCLSSERATAR